MNFAALFRGMYERATLPLLLTATTNLFGQLNSETQEEDDDDGDPSEE